VSAFFLARALCYARGRFTQRAGLAAQLLRVSWRGDQRPRL
jgi:hypothetical protein